MTGSELARIGSELYDGHGWQTKLAAELGRNTSTIRRWIKKDEVPFLAAEKIELLATSAPRPPPPHPC